MQILAKKFDVIGTVRHSKTKYKKHPIFKDLNLLGRVNAEKLESISDALDAVRPDFVINAIGIVKQIPASHDPIPIITVNSLLPHQLAQLCHKQSCRLIHMSTDCVFSGNMGNYSEDDVPDAMDLYGRTKLLGEVTYDNCLTIRTSIIGRELGNAHGLIEWFLSQNGKSVKGFQRAIFSGLTTNALSQIIAEIIQHQSELQGLWHVASEPISKFDLLTLVKEEYHLDIEIEPDITVKINRSLNAKKFKEKTNIKIPSWTTMIQEMHQDPTPYGEIRR